MYVVRVRLRPCVCDLLCVGSLLLWLRLLRVSRSLSWFLPFSAGRVQLATSGSRVAFFFAPTEHCTAFWFRLNGALNHVSNCCFVGGGGGGGCCTQGARHVNNMSTEIKHMRTRSQSSKREQCTKNTKHI